MSSCSSVVTINVGACIPKPSHQGLLGRSPIQGNSFPLGLGTGAESSQTCGVPPYKASPSRRDLNYLPLVSSDTLSLLVHYVRKLHSCNLDIAQTSCAVSRLACNSKNAQHSLEIVQILRLCGTYILTAHW